MQRNLLEASGTEEDITEIAPANAAGHQLHNIIISTTIISTTMPIINPYLNFKGNADEAFTFYKSIFGSDFLTVLRFKDTPEASKLPEKDLNKIMHIALPIGNGNILMATDALESVGHSIIQGNNFHLSVSTDRDEETRTIFNALAAGGKVAVPLDKMFWGSYFGMCTDKFGVQWMVSNDQKISNPK